MTRLGWLILSLAPIGVALLPASQTKRAEPVDFERQLMPIVKAKCLGCHGDTIQSGGLDMRTPEAWKKGGDSGPLFVAGKPTESILIERLVEMKPKPQMPLGFPPLKTEEIDLFRKWIQQGASFAPIRTYAADIQPILKANCFSCHSGANPKANLDLTTYEGTTKALEGSTLLKRIRGEGGLAQMPLGFGPLSPANQALIAEWVAQGAPEGTGPRTHWAYTPLEKPAIPNLESTWIKNPIDAFILDRLKNEGLRPSAPARPEALLRRASLDLIGLPPTLEELDRFTSGKETYGAALDRLLASPHYGERMASPWLDLARYADTNGYEKDTTRSVWKYRDWVVQAFNSNTPYDRFTIEQIAGDLLPKPTTEQLIATGFNRNAMLNLEGGVDQEEAMYEVRNDRVATTSMVWLGQTVACARCHDHKYDPISQKDYFRFYAFFANNVIEPRGDASISEQKYYEPTIEVPSPEQTAQRKRLETDLSKVAEALKTKEPQVVAEREEWLEKLKKGVWTAAKAHGEGLRVDGEALFNTTKSDQATFEVKFEVPPGTRAIRVAALADSSLPNKGPGTFGNGNFVLSKATIVGEKITRVGTSFAQNGFPASATLDDDPNTGWAIDPETGKSHEIVFETERPLTGAVTLRLECNATQYVKHILGKFAISTTTEPEATRFALPQAIKDALAKGDPSPAHAFFARVANANRAERERQANLQSELSRLRMQIPTAHVMREDKRKTEAPVRHRGEWLSPGEIVASATPEAMGPVATGSRLQLAKWLANPKNPLTARVQVNRLWEMVFGRGLVDTSDNFGTQGTPPSHPELLDWLAVTYIESGWDTKKLLKLILSSNTYRQSSATTKALNEKDPYNILLARGPRFRLWSEAIRDTALVASGLLNPKLGGPPVHPFQPEGVWDSPYTGETWVQSQAPETHRRALYTFLKRTAPYPSGLTLDAGSRETCMVRRPRTNTPLQALTLLNDQAMFEAAQALGKRFEKHPNGLALAFRAVTSRAPKPQELDRLNQLFAKVKAQRGEAMAWTMVGNVLLNLDEAITKE